MTAETAMFALPFASITLFIAFTAADLFATKIAVRSDDRSN